MPVDSHQVFAHPRRLDIPRGPDLVLLVAATRDFDIDLRLMLRLTGVVVLVVRQEFVLGLLGIGSDLSRREFLLMFLHFHR
jgi:hypothetical protein